MVTRFLQHCFFPIFLQESINVAIAMLITGQVVAFFIKLDILHKFVHLKIPTLLH